MENKLLTICLFGRNDNYTPDFLYRMTTAINFLANSAKVINRLDDVEILVVDWGSKSPLKDNMSLSVSGQYVTRFLFVPDDITSQYDPSRIPGNISMNIGMRRASGKVVGVCGAEVLIPPGSLNTILNIIDGNSEITSYNDYVFLCGRYRLPVDWVIRQPSVDQWLEFLQLNSWRIPQELGRGSFLTGNAGLFLIPRNTLYETQGLLEALDPGWGWNDVEYTIRASSKLKVIDLNSAGVAIYDMEHLRFTGDREVIMKKSAERLLSQTYQAQNTDWGAGTVFINKTPGHVNELVSDDKIKQYLIDNCCQISEKSLVEFSMWLSENVLLKPDEIEWRVLILIHALMKKRDILYYKEYGLNQGVSFYLAGYLSKYCSLIGIDRWQAGGGEFGPDHIAYNLTTNNLKHQGYLRIINRNLLSTPPYFDNKKYNTNVDGIVTYRLSDEDDFQNVYQELMFDLQHNIVVLIGANASSCSDYLGSLIPTINVDRTYDDEIITLSLMSLSYDVNKKTSSKILSEINGRSLSLTGLTVKCLFTKLEAIKNEQLIILVSSKEVFYIVFPYLKKNIIAIITDDEFEKSSMLSIPDEIEMISIEDVRLYPKAIIVNL